MRLAIEGLGATEGPTDGAGRYLSSLLAVLGRRTDISTIAYVGPSMRDVAQSIAGLDRVVVMPTRWRSARIAVQHSALPTLSAFHGADVVVYTSNYVPVISFQPSVAIAQNMFLARPDEAPGYVRAVYRRFMRLLITSRSHSVVAVSHSMARELKEAAPRLADRIQVVYPALDTEFFRSGAKATRQTDQPYFLGVGTVWPHRNFELALHALARSALDHQLVIAGAAPRREVYRLRRLASDLGIVNRLHFLGVVTPDEMPRWYGGATALVATSFIESFGMSVIEAMAARTPVIAVRRTAYQETVGDAALLVDPGPEELAEAMVEVTRPAMRSRLIAKGADRACLFDFTEHSDQLVSICRSCVERRQQKTYL